MAADPTQALEALVTNIRNLVLDDSYKTIAGVFDEIPRLNGLIESKDIELSNLVNEITELKSRHKDRLQEDLELYRTQQNKLEEEKVSLTGTISTLEATIQEKDDASAVHIRTQDALQEQLDQVTKLLDAEKEKVATANADTTNLLQSIKGKDLEIDNLKDSLQKEKTQNSKDKSIVENLSDKIASLQTDLQSSTTRLDEIESFTTKLEEEVDDTVWIKQLDEVWEASCRVVASLFKEDLAEERLKDESAWKDFRESRYLERAIPLPQSNSLAAKQMRIVALLAILARSITQHVFKPTYILGDKDERDEIRSLLVRLADINSKKESFCRALLLSIFPEDQATNGTKAMERVVREVSKCVRNLVSDAQYESFRSSVDNIVHKASGAWRLVQSTRDKFEPYFDLKHYVDFEWQPLNLDNDHIGVGDDSAVITEDDKALLMVFPRIYIIADSERDPVTPGVMLMKSQSTLASEEMEKNNPSSPTTSRAGPRSKAIRSRTMSVAVDRSNGFLFQTTAPGVH
ncbi:uncharacterized protein PAC_15999 [Phialocephala subalpina]|uniref:Uncharacterized protein n=1 Tax=Phialocephala subalpina TaxID=576137 RepID=A0A1L7XM62_9HELO|nr:uncharacterized protein PAC_15999 [Phialocephala subalpina]